MLSMDTPMDTVIILGERNDRLTQAQRDRLEKGGVLSVEDEKDLREEKFRLTVAREHADAPLPEWVMRGVAGQGWLIIREQNDERTLRKVEVASPESTAPEVAEEPEEAPVEPESAKTGAKRRRS